VPRLYVNGYAELVEVEILPVDGMISVSGSYNGRPIERGLVLLNGGQKLDLPWLQRNAKMIDAPRRI
jgi:hypothetical protein